MTEDTRAKAVDAVDILNDFIGDCVTGVMVLRAFTASFNREQNDGKALVALNKMCISYIVLTLYKWLEFYKKYHRVIPEEYKKTCKDLFQALERKNISEFRNKCVGHIWDNELNRPLFNSEIMERLNKIIENNLDNFLNWINNPNGNVYPKSVVSIVETLRDALVREHQIHPNEVIQR